MTEQQRPAWAARLQTEREKRGWSKPEMARRLLNGGHGSVTNLARQILDWEKGKHFPRNWSAAYATTFGIPETDLFGPRVITEISRPGPMPDLLGTPGHPTGRRADAGYVEELRKASQALVDLDTLHGGNDIFPLAVRAFRAAHRMIGAGAYETAIERELMAATGEAGEVAAWLAFDADLQEASRRIIHEALLVSRQAGDRDMELFELTHMAMQSVHLHRPAEALRISTDLICGGNLAPRVAALMDIRQGRALAQLNDEHGAMDALERARVALAEGISATDPPWTWWVTDAEVTWHLGMAHAELGDWAAAVPHFQESTDRRAAFHRAKYNDEVHLLNALTHVADWREAEPVITQAAAHLGHVGSARTSNLLRRVARRIVGADATSTVADLAADLGRTLDEAGTAAPAGDLF